MVGIIRMTRTSQGVSMKELAQRMGVGVQAVSTLELNDERGAIKIETRDRALRALGKRALPIIVDAIPEEIAAEVETEARALVERTQWSMALSGQHLSDDAVERMVKKVVAKRLAA
jgi:transcriptional regulator with XRE-family HTH domain